MALSGGLLRPDPTTYVVAFRLVALAAHLLNTWLVGRTLREMGRSPRAVTLGMLLYAWNPLVVMESCLNGHNDGVMVTFLLLGILLAVRAERWGQLLRVHGLVPPVVAFTLAALVKFPCLPILAAYVLFLLCKALRPTQAHPHTWRQALAHWPRAVTVLCWAGGTALLVALVLYGPFWIGHTPHAIVESFINNNAASWGVDSFMRSIIVWVQIHPALKHNHLLTFFSRRQVWNDLSFLGIACCFVLSMPHLWRQPTVTGFLTLALATMSLVLVITPWFWPWYLIWIVGLAALCIPQRQDRLRIALFASAFTFSACTLLVYLPGSALLGAYSPLSVFAHTLPPVGVFLLCWRIPSWRRKRHLSGRGLAAQMMFPVK